MSDSARSMIFGPSVLYGVAVIALVLTIVRRPAKNSDQAIDAIIRLYLIGIACDVILNDTGDFKRLSGQFVGEKRAGYAVFPRPCAEVGYRT
jgi:hypothetical protein